MYQEKRNNRSHTWGYNVYRVCLLGVMCLVLVALAMTATFAPAVYASGPGGNVADPAVRAVDIAKPAVVRIFTQVVSQLTVTFADGKSATFPLTPQQGFNGYPLDVTGTGAFISAHGDLLTADHVMNPVLDDRQSMDQFLDQTAAPDVATYINQRSQTQVTANQVAQELVSNQLQSTPIYQKAQSQVFLSTDYSGQISATSFQSLPPSQFATVDQIKESSPFTQFDTAIIHVNGMNNMPMLQLGDSSTVQEQDQLTIIGFPGNGDVNTSPNDFLTSSINVINVSSIKTLPGGAPLIQVGGNVEQGDSGGPALDSNGHVVGIVSFGTSTNGGGTSFLRASSSAKQMIQQAGIDTTPSAAQTAWSQALNDYASTVPGHWHQSTREFQKLSSLYPQFKAITPFLQYATQQAQSEKQTQEASTPTTTPGNNTPVGATGGLNPLYVIIGGLIVLLIIVFASFAIARSRRRKTSLPPMVATPPPGYGAPAASPYFGAAPGQSYSTLPVNASGVAQPQQGQFPPAPLPQTPSYPGQSAYPQSHVSAPQQAFRPQAPSPAPQQAFRPQQAPLSAPQPQQAFQPQAPSPAPQQAFRPQQAPLSAPQQAFRPSQPSGQQSQVGGMAAFGAPSASPPGSVPFTPQPSDSTIVARSGSSAAQWRIWPCGHTNRFDASFCGTCGESAPPTPIVRRLEQ